MPIARTLEMMAETVGTAIDPLCFEALKAVLEAQAGTDGRPASAIASSASS